MLARTPQNPMGFARKTALWSGILAVLAIYLFATRPEPLIDSRTSERTVSVEKVFRILAAENATMRALWTAEIVGAGTKAGLKFDEKWRGTNVAARPLQSFFPRESARPLKKRRAPPVFFLGSDSPIAQKNFFPGEQPKILKGARAPGNQDFLKPTETAKYRGLFAAVGVAPACVSCHN